MRVIPPKGDILSYEIPFEQVENYVEIDDDSYATIFDLEDYRKGLIAEMPADDVTWQVGSDEDSPAQVNLDGDDRVTPATLQPENRSHGHGGARSKRRRNAVKPLTPEERMDRRCRIMRDTGPDAYLPETDGEYEARKIQEVLRKQQRKMARGGRPRKGGADAEFREHYQLRLEPKVPKIIEEATGLNLIDFLEAQAASFQIARVPTGTPLQDVA